MKQDKGQEIVSLKQKLDSVQNERTEIMAQNAIYEEKLKNHEEEKQKIETKYEEKIRELTSENGEEMKNLLEENGQLADILKTKEEQYFMSNNKLSKLNALLEQKMDMVEAS